jgi:hypothetical protein
MTELDLTSFRVEGVGQVVKSVHTHWSKDKARDDELFALIAKQERHKGMLKLWCHHSSLYKWWTDDVMANKDVPDIDQGDFELFEQFFSSSTEVRVVLKA